MSSREQILDALRNARRPNDRLPEMVSYPIDAPPLEKLRTVLESIGGSVIEVLDVNELKTHLISRFVPRGRWITAIKAFRSEFEEKPEGADPHSFENVQLAIVEGHFAVAENGAVWVTSDQMGDRALPFICEHLALVVRRGDIVETMQQAYTHLGLSSYPFGAFIAGPSKTADIEQSLVLGAHGPKSLTLFLIS